MIMIMEPKKATQYNYFVVFSLLCSCYVTDMINYNYDYNYNFI